VPSTIAAVVRAAPSSIVGTHDVDLAAREALGDLAAESAAGSGDDGDLHAAVRPRQRTNR